MLTFLLCDDNQYDLEVLKNSIACQFSSSQVIIFSDPDKVVQYYKTGGVFNVALLDIIMPQMDGTELALALREIGYTGYIIFLTTSNEFASQSYEVRAFDYIIKPIKEKRLKTTLTRVQADFEKKDMSGMSVTIGRAVQHIFFRDIIVAESRNRQVRLQLSDGNELMPYMTLRDCREALLKDERFAQCHNSYLINMDYVRTVTARTVVLQSGEKICISRSYADFQTRYMQRLMGKGD